MDQQGLAIWRYFLDFSLHTRRFTCSHVATAKLRGFSLFSFFSHLLLAEDITRNFFGTTLRTINQTNNVQSDVG